MKKLLLALITTTSINAFAADDINIRAGHLFDGTGHVRETRALIKLKGDSARKLYLTLVDVAEREVHGQRTIRESRSIICSKTIKATFSCSFKLNSNGEFYFPQVSEQEQQQQSGQVTWPQEQRQQNHDRQVQQRQHPIAEVIF